MKKILTIFAISLFMMSCSDNQDVTTNTLDGTLQCLNNNPIAGVQITITDDNGATQSSTTDASGNFSFDNLAEVDYTMNFVDPALHSYSQAEYETITQDLRNVILKVRDKTNIDHIAYNTINYEDGLTTYDMVFFDKLKTGDILMSEIVLPWRYVFTTELNSNDAVTNQLEFTYTQDLDLDINAIFVGDISGFSCQ